MSRTLKLLLAVAVLIAIPASFALAMGFKLGESKEDLKLNYDVSIYDHDTGRVTIKFILDFTMSMALRKDGEKRVGSIHIRKVWAERAEIQIKTGHLDGKQEPRTWYYHSIPLNELVARAKPHETVN